MTETWSNEGYDPDFIERNGAWLLSVFGIISACISGMLVYFLKSRCRTIKCCGMECERDVLDLTTVPESAISRRVNAMSALRRATKPSEPTNVNSESSV